jgi:hypothetical protein
MIGRVKVELLCPEVIFWSAESFQIGYIPRKRLAAH